MILFALYALFIPSICTNFVLVQWFGNLVTPDWWDDLWLNEGFASYVEYLGVDYVEPGWEMVRLEKKMT